MRKLFMAEMEAVGDQLVEMATLVNRAMKQARVALETQDLGLAETVITQAGSRTAGPHTARPTPHR